MVKGNFSGGELAGQGERNWDRHRDEPGRGLSRVSTAKTAAGPGLSWRAGKDGINPAKTATEKQKSLLAKAIAEGQNFDSTTAL